MERPVVFWALILTLLLGLFVAQVSAGGPVCPPSRPMCAPPACAPPLCAPPMPVCAPLPRGPACPENPLCRAMTGLSDLVICLIAAPFKCIDSQCWPDGCAPSRYPQRGPAPVCAPPVCMPPPPVHGPAGHPGMGMGRPGGFGQGVPKARRLAPFAERESPRKAVTATARDGFLGSYW